MVSRLVLISGLTLIIIGIAGFIPGVTRGGMSLGLFEVGLIFNLIHLISGILAVAMALRGDREAVMLAWVLAVVYGLLAILAFIFRGDLVVMELNSADSWLYVVFVLIWGGIGLLGLSQRRDTSAV